MSIIRKSVSGSHLLPKRLLDGELKQTSCDGGNIRYRRDLGAKRCGQAGPWRCAGIKILKLTQSTQSKSIVKCRTHSLPRLHSGTLYSQQSFDFISYTLLDKISKSVLNR